MANTTLIQTVTVGAGGQASIDFNAIPSTFTDLLIVVSARDTNTPGNPDDGLFISFNGSTTGYSNRVLYGLGSGSGATATNSYGFSTKAYVGALNTGSATASTFGNTSIYIPNYTASNAKNFSSDSVIENNATAVVGAVNSSAWTGTAAITSISLTTSSATNFVQYSTASLYGITSTVANGTPKATGGTITYGAGGTVFHTFTASGTFTPTASLTADVLVVGGGGKGASGGGGAGGYRTGSLTVSSPVTVTVGAGQAGLTWADGGGQGSSSTFDTITSAGGGGGGAVNANNAGSGGSGGGSGGSSGPGVGPGAGNTPSTSPAQGYSGGSWNGYANNQYGAGGGGASAVGGNSNATSNGGAGGAGTTWLNGTTYSIGGKGMEANTTGASGAANTGIGGAGGFTGGSGGSGIVIVRYQG